MPPEVALPGGPPDGRGGMKRKQPPGGSQGSQSSRSRKRIKMQDARVIATQTTTQAFENGEIDVDKFVKARAYEITALEEGMQRAKKTLSTRAFQNVPRELRRRTASHNAKRVPKRIRARAVREVSREISVTTWFD